MVAVNIHKVVCVFMAGTWKHRAGSTGSKRLSRWGEVRWSGVVVVMVVVGGMPLEAMWEMLSARDGVSLHHCFKLCS